MKKQTYPYEIIPSIGMFTSCAPMDTNRQWSDSVSTDTNYQWNASYSISENCQCYGDGSTAYCQHNGMANDMEKMIWLCKDEIYWQGSETLALQREINFSLPTNISNNFIISVLFDAKRFKLLWWKNSSTWRPNLPNRWINSRLGGEIRKYNGQ